MTPGDFGDEFGRNFKVWRLGTRNHIAGHPRRCMEVIAVACLHRGKLGLKRTDASLSYNKIMVPVPRSGIRISFNHQKLD